MKTTDLKGKSKEVLQKMLREKREKLRQLRFDLSQDKLKNVKEFGAAKKEIARILTIMNSNSKNSKSAK